MIDYEEELKKFEPCLDVAAGGQEQQTCKIRRNG